MGSHLNLQGGRVRAAREGGVMTTEPGPETVVVGVEGGARKVNAQLIVLAGRGSTSICSAR
jgi:hypothetical protein